MLTAKQAYKKALEAIEARQVTFEQAIETINQEIEDNSANGFFFANVAFQNWMELKTCKKVKKYLKKHGFKQIVVEEDYISCEW